VSAVRIESADGARLAASDDIATAKRLTDVLPGAFRLVRASDGIILAQHSKGGLGEHLHTYGRVELTRPRVARTPRRGA
jgi:hypothetical protein